jgi:hypothetical protein
MRPVADVYQNRFLENWQEISTIRKPIIAAVSGFAVNHSFLSLPCPALTRPAMFRFLNSSAEAASSR